jgi:hypothetical protein
MTAATLAALVATLLIGGVFLGWVASVNWKRSLATPAEWRSISYIYGTTIILLCFAVRCIVANDAAGLGDLVICVVGCGAWTVGTHRWHAWQDARDVAAVAPLGEGDET